MVLLLLLLHERSTLDAENRSSLRQRPPALRSLPRRL